MVVTIDARNPSAMTGVGNHTYLIATPGGSAALIDAGVGETDHLAEIGERLRAVHARLDHVLVTHAHADHASGAPALAALHPTARFSKYPWPDEDPKYGVDWRAIDEGDTIAMGDERLTVVRTPGHSPDHVAFWHEQSRAVFSGDLVVAGSSVMIHTSRGGNLSEYLASLRRLITLEPRVLYPAHGPRPDDPDALLRAYLDHRQERELQVIAALADGRSTVPAIAESIYHGLDPALMPAARENVRAHLDKLEAEGRAAADGGLWRLCG